MQRYLLGLDQYLQRFFPLSQSQDSRKKLQAAIQAHADEDKSFEHNLRRLVSQYQNIEKVNSNVFQNTEFGSNFNSSNVKANHIGPSFRYFRH